MGLNSLPPAALASGAAQAAEPDVAGLPAGIDLASSGAVLHPTLPAQSANQTRTARVANEAPLAPTAQTPEAPSPARVVTGPIEGAARRVVEPPPEPEVKAPKGPKVEGPEGTSDSYTPDEGHPIEAPPVDEGKVVALGGAVEGRAGILGTAEADAAAFRQQAAEEQQAQDELAATQSVQRKASGPPGGPAGGGGGPAPAAPVGGLEATAADEAAIRAQAGAEFSGFSAGAKDWSPKGGGGGGSPVVAKPPPPVPNVAGREPASALAALGALPPAQILGAMGGVAAAATKAVGKKERTLASAPPTKRIAAGPAGPGAPPAKPKIDTKVEEVKPSGGKAPEVKAGEEQVEAPPIVLAGETDPANVAAQEAAGKAAAAAASNAAKAGLATPRGEERLHPKVKPQTVKPPVQVGGGGVEVASEGVGQAEASIVAFQEKPGELHSAVAKGSGQLSKAAAEATKKEAKEKKESDREIKKAEADHAKELKEEQAKGRKEVAKERKKADSQHAKLVSSHSKEATAKKAEAITKVKTEKAKGDTDAKREVREANTKIASEKRKGEEKARKAEEEEKKKDSGGGVWGAIKRGASAVASAVRSAVKAVVDAVKSAVKSIVTAVVSAVGSVLKGVWNAIKSVVKAALDVIKKLAAAFLDALKALIDAALALIDSLIKAALAALQALAELLPGVLGKLLGALVSALKAVYDALKAAYKAAIEAVKSAVKAVVSWAKSAIAALGMLAALVKDIASAPGRWFSNLLASAKDGIMNHLWGALKGAVKAWWDGKVKNLIGAPQEVLALLVKGGITFAMVLTMAWEAIKAALPELIIQQLIEKVVSALNVGAGTALLLLRALQAAWASIGAIVGAIQKFFGFLRAVKGGGAGPQFAAAVAAGAVAVIEFVSNFLMARLGSKLKPFKDKLSGLAKKIGEKLLGATKKAGSRIVKAGKAVLDNVRSRKLGKIVERGIGKAVDLKKKYDAWKYGTKDGTSKWAGAGAAEEAAWSQKVHQKTGGRFGAATTSSTPHRTTGGEQSDTTSTATKHEPGTHYAQEADMRRHGVHDPEVATGSHKGADDASAAAHAHAASATSSTDAAASRRAATDVKGSGPAVVDPEPGVHASAAGADGHTVKVTDRGLVECTTCDVYRHRHADKLEAHPDLRQRLDEVDAMPSRTSAEAAEKAKALEGVQRELSGRPAKPFLETPRSSQLREDYADVIAANPRLAAEIDAVLARAAGDPVMEAKLLASTEVTLKTIRVRPDIHNHVGTYGGHINEGMNTKATGHESHHGIMDEWLAQNVPGYTKRSGATINLSIEGHNTTKLVEKEWRPQLPKKPGSARAVDWKAVPESDMRKMAAEMMQRAGVPRNKRIEFFAKYDTQRKLAAALASVG